MFDVNIKNFNKAAAMVGTAIARRSTIPVLSTMKVSANGRLVLEGTDLDHIIKVSMPCESKADVEFLINDAPAVISAIGAAGGECATFAATEDGFTVRAGQLNRVSKHGQALEAYPADGCSVSIEAFSATFSPAALAQIERIMPAIATEETRYYLNGVYFHHLADWTYRAVATDGHRLMTVDIQLPDATGELLDVIIPRRSLINIMKNMRKIDGPISFRLGTRHLSNAEDATLAPVPRDKVNVAFSGTLTAGAFDADVSISTRTIDGKYPDYARVIPASNKHTPLFSVPELRQAVLAISAGCKDIRAVKIAFGPKSKGVDVSMNNRGEGVVDSTYHIDADHDFPAGFAIGINGKYLLDMLAAIGGTEVIFGADDQAAPCKLLSPSDTSFQGVLMPMRI